MGFWQLIMNIFKAVVVTQGLEERQFQDSDPYHPQSLNPGMDVAGSFVTLRFIRTCK